MRVRNKDELTDQLNSLMGVNVQAMYHVLEETSLDYGIVPYTEEENCIAKIKAHDQYSKILFLDNLIEQM